MSAARPAARGGRRRGCRCRAARGPSARRSEPRVISTQRRSSGVPTKMYVEPRSAATRRTASTRSSPSSSRKWTPRIEASRRRAASCVASSASSCCPGRRIQSASISPPRRWDDRHARRSTRCDRGCGSTSARTRSPTACLLSGSRIATATARLDVLRDLAQRELAERREVVLAEEVQQRALRLPARVDLAGAEPVLQRLGRDVDEHDLVGLVEHRGRGTSPGPARR